MQRLKLYDEALIFNDKLYIHFVSIVESENAHQYAFEITSITY